MISYFKRISAHKNLLALVSEVFEKMFEYNNEDNDCSTVNDGSVSAKRMRLIQVVFYVKNLQTNTV